MKKRVRAMAWGAAILFALMPHVRAAQETASPVSVAAKACLLMERETGTILYEENAHEQLEPASVTKVMTMLLVAEALDEGALSPDDVVSVSAHAAGMGGSQVYLEEGEQMSVHELLKATAVASGNDAAVALGEQLKGSEEAFVARMNERAAELGMKDTHFCNCTGLPCEGHVSSAYDIALMSRELLSHAVIRDYVSIWQDSIRNGAFELANTNKLIYYYPGATGLKTGSTDAAGYCISASAEREGMELIAVILGSETSSDRFESAKALLNFGFGGWTLCPVPLPDTLPQVPVKLGEREWVEARPEGEARVLVKREQAAGVETQWQVYEQLTAPVEAGDMVGTLRVLVEGEVCRTVPLLAGQDSPRLRFGKLFSALLAEGLPVG